MKKRSNGVLVIIIIMIIISLAGGIVGLLASMRDTTEKPKDDTKPENYEVTYRYYIDSEEVDKEKIDELKGKTKECDQTDPTCVPTIEKATIKFEKYNCTNNVKGEWDNTNWSFTPDLTANTTCRLYFTNLTHEIKVNVTNGTLPVDNPEGKLINTMVDNQTVDSTIIITPTAGYKFDKVECDNNATGEFNIETNLLTIKNVTKNTICNISFKINDYTVEIRTSNGTSSDEPKSANYGGTVTFNVTPAENYGDAIVTCTNDQKATYANNVLTVSSITNNTVCTVQFKPLKHTVNLTVVNGSLGINNSPQTTQDGGTVSFDVSKSEGFGFTNAELSCDVEGQKIELQSNGTGTAMVFVYNVKSNLNCKLVLKKLEG